MSKALFFDQLSKVDEILMALSFNENDKKELLRLIENPVIRAYFYEKIENTSWLIFLSEINDFQNPPTPVLHEDQGTVSFPIWGASRYLARIAKKSPDDILKIALKIPPTENVRVHEDLSDIALAMPPKLSAMFVDSAKDWVKSPYQLLLSQKLGKLIVHLAKGGEIDAAYELARVVLEIVPGDPNKPQFDQDRKSRSRIKDWDYQEIIKEISLPLISINEMRTLTLFSDLLKQALVKPDKNDREEDYEDYSYIWRSRITDTSREDFKDLLVTAVFQTAKTILDTDPSKIDEIATFLEEQKWQVFHRIAMHLVNTFAEHSKTAIHKLLMNRNLLLVDLIEYKTLLENHYGSLTDGEKVLFLSWIEAGPYYEKSESITPERQPYTKFWQRDRLSWIQKHLPRERQDELNALALELGPQREFNPSGIGPTWIGPTSPKSVDELNKMSVQEIVGYLSTWSSPQQMFAHSKEGLGRTLESAVKNNPNRFAIEAHRFEGLDPTYVRALFQGLKGTVSKTFSFEWNPILDLCSWVISQPIKIPGRVVVDGILDADPDWSWTRRTIADLFLNAFQTGATCLPLTHREKIKPILIELTKDSDPGREDEAKEGGIEKDPLSVSISTTRGEAMHATIQYALWVFNAEKKPGNLKSESRPKGFSGMPEIKEILESHLDPKVEQTSAIRSVYGQWFPWLTLIDVAWAKKNVSRIFPMSKKEGPFPHVAWEAYLRMNPPYDEVFEILKDRYLYYVHQLKNDKADAPNKLEESLASHVTTLALRKQISIDPPDELWKTFWEKASPVLRAKTIDNIGRSFYQTKEGEKFPASIVKQAKAIWEQRLEFARRHIKEVKQSNEMEGFGWWFAADKFDDDWTIPKLLETLTHCGKAVYDHFIIRRLATKIIKVKPLQAIQLLSALINLGIDGFGIMGSMSEVRQIIEAARDSEDQEARSLAIDLINRLGAMGYLEFRDLLSASGLIKGNGQN